MKSLGNFRDDIYSQFGEDGCIRHIFEQIGVKDGVAVEFGASDGLSSSNTAHLWRDEDWTAFLVEADHERYCALGENITDNVDACEAYVTPTGLSSIASLMAGYTIAPVDFMSIDVDGDDYAILAALEVRPRVICVEFNPTVPPHMELRQAGLGGMFGASLLAFVRLAPKLGYRFVGATYCNAFLVLESEAEPFDGYECDPTVLFSPEAFTYAVSDFAGRTVLCGSPLPWGARDPYVLPLTPGDIAPITSNVHQIRRGFESWWGPALWLTPNDLAAETVLLSHNKFRALLKGPLICVDLSSFGNIRQGDWMRKEAVSIGYRPLACGPVLGLIRRKEGTQW